MIRIPFVMSLAIAGLILSAPSWPQDEDLPGIEVTDAAKRLHESALLVDGHNDLPGRLRRAYGFDLEGFDFREPNSRFHTDLPRLLQGGVGAQFWVAYVPVSYMYEGGAARYCIEQIDLIHRFINDYPETLELALSADDIERIHRSGKVASLIGVEGGHAIEDSIGVLRAFYQLGARYMTLTHSDTTPWADAATDEGEHGGLTEFGEEVVREMNRLGMLVDISHVSAETMRDVLRVSTAPVIASHSSAYSLSPTGRNVPDDVLKMVKENNGVVMVNFFPAYLTEYGAQRTNYLYSYFPSLNNNPDLSDEEKQEKRAEWNRENPRAESDMFRVADHIDHIVEVAGINHVGIGSDYDGIPTTPRLLEDISTFPNLTQELLNRGYSETEIRKILGGNFMRVFREAEAAAE